MRATAPRRKLAGMRAAAVMAVVCLTLGCNRGAAPGANGEQPALLLTADNVTRVERGRVESGPLLSGILSPLRQAALRSQASGEVTAVFVERGQTVKQGQLLVRIEDRATTDELASAQAAVAAARQAQALAQKEERRARFMFESGAIAQRDYDAVQQGLSSAKAQLSAALAQLAGATDRRGNARIVAPFDGVVGDRPVNVGDVVAPGMALLTVVDGSALKLEASVPSAEALEMRRGTAVEFRVQGIADQTFTGNIEWVSPEVDAQTRQLEIQVRLPNQDRALLPGLYAEGRVAVVRKEALTVDTSALRTAGNERSVLRIREDVVERVPVKLGLVDDIAERAEVIGGLREGDLLVAGNAPDVSEGARVKVEAGGRPGEAARARRPAGR